MPSVAPSAEPAPLPELAREFSALLKREREAALKADVDTLVALQEQKGELMKQIKVSGLEAAIIDDLGALARANIQLMRHLVACLRGAVEKPGEPTYNAKGETRSAGQRLVRAAV